MEWVVLMILIYFWGVGSHYWPTPLGVMTSLWWRMTNRWSDADVMTNGAPDADVMTRTSEGDVDHPEGDVDLARIVRRPFGPRPIEELLGDQGDGSDEDDDQYDEDLPDRIAWVAQQMQDGVRSTDIDAEGADLYRVAPRTIARDRRNIAHRAASRRGHGTMNGDRR